MKKLLLFFFSHRALALVRWDLYFLKIRFINVIKLNRVWLNRTVRQISGKKYLNLGSGPRGLTHKQWINIDGFKDINVHYLCDFNRPLPFKDETFDAIFCEHVIEHFDFASGKLLILECLRILKKGGVLRVIVPDGEKILKSYFSDPEFIVKYKNSESGLPMEAVNTWFYQRYEHQCIYDAAYMIHLLTSAGFSKSGKTEFNITNNGINELLIDDEKYKWESLYVEAIK